MTLSQALQARYQNVVPVLRTAAVFSTVNLDIDTFEEEISASITQVYDTLAPLRTITIPDKRKPWVTPEILRVMKKRDKAHKARPYDHEKFELLRSRASNALDSAKSTFIAQKISMATSAKQRGGTLH